MISETETQLIFIGIENRGISDTSVTETEFWNKDITGIGDIFIRNYIEKHIKQMFKLISKNRIKKNSIV